MIVATLPMSLFVTIKVVQVSCYAMGAESEKHATHYSLKEENIVFFFSSQQLFEDIGN